MFAACCAPDESLSDEFQVASAETAKLPSYRFDAREEDVEEWPAHRSQSPCAVAGPGVLPRVPSDYGEVSEGEEGHEAGSSSRSCAWGFCCRPSAKSGASDIVVDDASEDGALQYERVGSGYPMPLQPTAGGGSIAYYSTSATSSPMHQQERDRADSGFYTMGQTAGSGSIAYRLSTVVHQQASVGSGNSVVFSRERVGSGNSVVIFGGSPVNSQASSRSIVGSFMVAAPSHKSGLLGGVVQQFREALVADVAGNVIKLQRVPLIAGFESYAAVLDRLGGGMGSYILANTTKLRNSKASPAETSYREWLFTELPVHKATGYKGYVDDSAWMANVWISWTFEFFVELFAQLHSGKGTRASADAAYAGTLKAHHNWIQSATFSQAVKRLPQRDAMYQSLQGTAEPSDVVREVGDFVNLGRPIVAFCLRVNDELEALLKKERSK
mmetsp:Transcript_47972/g.133776  ORF Transcript_47972/g.133776 Transcript_47972/m.133776 type:complete len:441 (-) Transcript_47972:216-1538(-)